MTDAGLIVLTAFISPFRAERQMVREMFGTGDFVEVFLDTALAGRDVLIVEDVVDSGLTLSWLRENLESRGPASVEICALLRKPEAAKVEIDVKYVGFDIPTDFVVGYGLDYAEKYRNLRDVAVLAPHVYSGE